MNKLRIFIIVAVLLIGGIMCTVSSVSDMIKLNGDIPDFNFVSIADIEENDFTAGYIYNIYDCYAGETTTNTTMGIETSSYTSREYFIMPLINDTDLNNKMFISVSVSDKDDRDLMYKISDATYEYLNGNEDVEFPEMEFFAKARPMDDELMGYMLDWFEETEYFEGGRSEARKHIVPYDLVMYDPSNLHIGLIVGLVMIGLSVGVIIFVLHLRKKNSAAPAQQDFTGYSRNDLPPSGGYAAGNTMEAPQSGSYAPSGTYTPAAGNVPNSGNGFAESPSYAPSPVPMVDLPQPPDPEEFFAKPAREHRSEPVKKVPPKAPEPEKPAPPPVDYANGIETDTLDTDKALAEQEEEVAARRKPIQGSEGILTETLDTDKALAEQEEEVAARRKPIQGSEEILTETLDTDKALFDQEQEVAARRKPIQGSEGILTETLDTDKALAEQEEEVAAHRKPIQGSEEIDTSTLDMIELGYFDTSAAEDNSDEIFDFTNDIDYDVGDGSDIEVT